MHCAPRVLTDEVRRNFLDGRGNGASTPFEQRLTESDDAGIRVHLQKDPARLDEKRL